MYNYLFYLKWSVMRGSSSLVLCHCAHLLMTYSYLVSWEWLNSPLTVVSSIPCTDLFIQVCLCIIFVFFKFTSWDFIRSWQLANAEALLLGWECLRPWDRCILAKMPYSSYAPAYISELPTFVIPCPNCACNESFFLYTAPYLNKLFAYLKF